MDENKLYVQKENGTFAEFTYEEAINTIQYQGEYIKKLQSRIDDALVFITNNEYVDDYDILNINNCGYELEKILKGE